MASMVQRTRRFASILAYRRIGGIDLSPNLVPPWRDRIALDEDGTRIGVHFTHGIEHVGPCMQFDPCRTLVIRGKLDPANLGECGGRDHRGPGRAGQNPLLGNCHCIAIYSNRVGRIVFFIAAGPRTGIHQIDGKMHRVRMYRCPKPIDASPLGSMAKLKGMQGGSR